MHYGTGSCKLRSLARQQSNVCNSIETIYLMTLHHSCCLYKYILLFEFTKFYSIFEWECYPLNRKTRGGKSSSRSYVNAPTAREVRNWTVFFPLPVFFVGTELTSVRIRPLYINLHTAVAILCSFPLLVWLFSYYLLTWHVCLELIFLSVSLWFSEVHINSVAAAAADTISQKALLVVKNHFVFSVIISWLPNVLNTLEGVREDISVIHCFFGQTGVKAFRSSIWKDIVCVALR